MLESSFLGIFFFGWNKLSKKQHLFATFCLALGSSLSALLILVANGFMQVPAGGHFVWQTMRMETTSLAELFFNPIAQIGFVHTVLAGYTTAAVFVVGISAFYLLRHKDVGFAKRSMAVGLGFGIVTSIMVMVLGDHQGLDAYQQQPMKLAAIESVWNTPKPPANFNVIAVPDQQAQKNLWSLQLPGFLGLLLTHNLHTKVYGIKTILYDGYTNVWGQWVPSVVNRIKSGAIAYEAMMKLREGDTSEAVKAAYQNHKKDLGYGMLLLPYVKDKPLTQATSKQIQIAARSAVPDVTATFWTFRVMVLMGLLIFLTLIVGIILLLRKTLMRHRWVLRWMLYMIPAPWIACLCGWFVTEHGRQPWTVYGMLPTSLSASTINAWDVLATLLIFVLFDLTLFVVELFLMFKFARLGPSSLHTGRYDHEQQVEQEG